MALFLQQFKREGNVMGGQGRAVVEPRGRADVEKIGIAVIGDVDAFRHQPVDRIRLVGGARHQ